MAVSIRIYFTHRHDPGRQADGQTGVSDRETLYVDTTVASVPPTYTDLMNALNSAGVQAAKGTANLVPLRWQDAPNLKY